MTEIPEHLLNRARAAREQVDSAPIDDPMYDEQRVADVGVPPHLARRVIASDDAGVSGSTSRIPEHLLARARAAQSREVTDKTDDDMIPGDLLSATTEDIYAILAKPSFIEFLRDEPSMDPERVASREKHRLGFVAVASVVTAGLALSGHEKAAKWVGAFTGLQVASIVVDRMFSNAVNSLENS